MLTPAQEIPTCLERIDMNIHCFARCRWWSRLFNTKYYQLCKECLGRDIQILKDYRQWCHKDMKSRIDEQIEKAERVYK